MALDTFDGRDIGALAKATPDEMAAKAKELFNEPEKLENWRHEVRRFVENRHSQTFAYAEMADHYSAIERSGR
jgi:hypothetical protein